MTEGTRDNGSIFDYPEPLPPDHLNEIGVLKRREIELRILMPMLRAFAREFGDERVLQIARDVIVDVARGQGEALSAQQGGGGLTAFAATLDDWKKGDAYKMQVLQESEQHFDFNVTRCQYAEMYRRLGVPELGQLLSCARDFALIEGFDPSVALDRTQTIMEGASHCDFRFAARRPAAAPSSSPADPSTGQPGGTTD
jgi:hypothetical protein